MQLTNVTPVYESGFFELPSSRLTLHKSEFHMKYPTKAPILVNGELFSFLFLCVHRCMTRSGADSFHPEFPAERKAIATTLDVITWGMDDAYVGLQTIDSAGLPTFGMTPDWIPWVHLLLI